MGDVTVLQKNSASFLDLSSVLGTYNRWCYRVQKVNYLGDLQLLTKRPFLGILGGRKLSSYGSRAVEEWVNKIGVLDTTTIVTGDLSGVERMVLRVAKAKKLSIVLVVRVKMAEASRRYDWVVDSGGLVICLGGLGMPRFLATYQHRLIAGIAKKVLFFEVGNDSGSFKTALEYGKRKIDLYCIPYEYDHLYGNGGNKLIAMGVAKMASEVSDVIEVSVKRYIDIEKTNKVIVGYRKNDTILGLIEEGCDDLERLVEKSGLGVSEVLVRVQELLDSGVVVQKGEKYFAS